MIKNIPIVFQNTEFSAADQEQISLLFENASRKLLDVLGQRLGASVAEGFTIYVTNADPVPAVLEEKTIAITSGSQVILPSSGKDGMSKVTVDGVNIATETTIGALDFSSGDAVAEVTLDTGDCEVTVTKPETLIAANIKKDIVIFGITGTYEA